MGLAHFEFTLAAISIVFVSPPYRKSRRTRIFSLNLLDQLRDDSRFARVRMCWHLNSLRRSR